MTLDVCNSTHFVVKPDVQPSYLKWFETDCVTLIYAKKSSISSISNESNLSNNDIEPDTSIEDCDLTGQPLQVDLGDELSDTVKCISEDGSIQIWPIDELKHFPLPVRDARRELNKILKKGKPKVGEPPAYYVLCAGDDNKKTILLGANVNDFMGCSVQILEPKSQMEVESSVKDMVDDHLKDCYGEKQVKYLVKMSYNLYGNNLENIPTQKLQLRQSRFDGNISADIASSRNVFRLSRSDVADMKMNVAVVAGHPHLKLNSFWQELMKLQRILSILSESEGKIEAQTSFCGKPLEMDDIFQSITKLVSLKHFYPINKKTTVDLTDLRHLNLLDRLWNILSCCENLSVLKDSFNFLFSELLEAKSNIILVDMSDNISSLIKRILEGHRGMPANSLKQSAEFLFELGARKLKLDFQTIFSQFISSNNINVDCIWKSFCTTPQTKLGSCSTSNMEKNNQMAYLGQLYIASELFYLVKEQVNMNDDGLKPFCQAIEHEYIFNQNKISDFKDVIHNPLRSIDFSLEMKQAPFLENISPSHWILRMETGPQTTIYHLSAYPIFPPNFHCYVPNPDNGLPWYYVTKMSRSSRRVY